MTRIFPVVLIAASAFAQTVQVAGVVTNNASGSPMRRVHIVLTPSSGRAADARSTVTSGDGAFSFDVPAGKYSLSAEYLGISQTYGNGGGGVGFGSAIIAAPDKDTAHLDFRWHPRGSIYGRVTDDKGE